MDKQQVSNIFSAVVPAPFGAVGIRTDAGRVREIVYLPPSYLADLSAHDLDGGPADGAAEHAARQVERYLDDPDFVFDLPLAEAGSSFQRRVWDAIGAIPRGSVRTYGQIAKLLESVPRPIGQACGANPFPLVIPCHRVTAAGGLGGFAGADDEHGFQLGIKRWLLRHEGVLATDMPWQQQSIFP